MTFFYGPGGLELYEIASKILSQFGVNLPLLNRVREKIELNCTTD